MFVVSSATRAIALVYRVGDIDQLPSVGASSVLNDVISSKAATGIRLTETVRQATKSETVVSAHRLNGGDMPELAPPGAGSTSDFYFISCDDPNRSQ